MLSSKNKKGGEQKKWKNRREQVQNGITLIALVISIIVMLILAGVSINAIVGDNGILTQAQTATFSQKIASYKEEMELNIVGNSSDFVPEREKVTAINDNIRQYIPSIEDSDVGKFGIIAGELYYLGTDVIEKQVATNQGLNTKADDQSVEDFVASVENNALEAIIKNMAGDAFFETDEEGNQKEIGVALKNKGVGVANWKIITEIENGTTKATYGTDWHYVEAGAEIAGIGKLTSDYIINYKTGKAVKFDASKHTMLADGAGIAAGKDYLVCNIDPSAIESGSTDFGTGVEFVNFENIQNAFTTSSFVFDGVDDYIKIEYDSPEAKQKSAENGFTFEFYGIYDGGTSYKLENNVLTEYEASYKGLFCYWNGNEKEQALFRFGTQNGKNFYWNPGWSYANNDMTDFSAKHNIMYPESELVQNGKEVYITVVLDASQTYIVNGFDCYHQSVYINGELFCEGNFNKKRWDNFGKDALGDLKYFCLGRSSQENEGWWHYSKLNSYALRLYSKGLSENEVIANYNATVAYHNILSNGGNSETGGEIGGEDIGSIE